MKKIIASIYTLIFCFISVSSYANIDIPTDPTGLSAKFAINKNLCSGDPATHPDITNCELEPIVAQNAPVFYIFTVTNPWGEPQQVVQLNDTYPASFAPSGSVTCQNNSGASVGLLPSSSASTIAIFNLGIGETVHCTVPGTFTANGQVTNRVTGTNNDDYSINSSVNTAVIGTTPSGVDLEVIKTAAQPSLDISTGATTQGYVIKVKNNSNQSVDVGNYFKLHDKLSLLPNSVPFRANLVSSTCNSSPGTDCVGQPHEYGNNQILVGTMGSSNFLRWEFPTGSSGTIAANGHFSIKFEVRYEKLEGLSCVVAPGADGVRNTAFFTLIGTSSALSESNPANNTSHANTKLTTGNTTVDPHCGKGHLKVTKEQIEPSNPVAWGNNVGYKITIKNQSIPAQDIVISARDIQDWVTQGINTPPFTRYHLDTDCLSSTDSSVCNTLGSTFDNINQTGYHYYGQTEKAWDSGANSTITLQHGHEIIIGTEMFFKNPDCETVPAAPNKPIINTAMVRYKATPYGALSANDPQIGFSQSASATTLMRNNSPCKFTVTKEADNADNKGFSQLEFGVPFNYRVTFRSDEPDRKIGTVTDLIRLSTSTYANSLNFSSSWTCTDNGLVSGYQANGSFPTTGSAQVGFTSTPAQGFPAVQLRSAPLNRIFFQQGGVINCNVEIMVKRPPYDSSLCESDPVRFQNLGLMDVTYPFNNNIAWPPAGGYDANDWQRPNVQDKNWAMADKLMPKCIDAMLNKKAVVAGLPPLTPTTAAWTKESGPDVDFEITVTNTAQGSLSSLGNNWPFDGMTISDDFEAPYINGNRASESCSNGSISGNPNWCSTSSINPIRQLGIANLLEGENGTWNYTHVAPFVAGEDMVNCAAINPNGQMNPNNNGAYYTNFQTPVMLSEDENVKQSDCVTVPVIRTTTINVTKRIQDSTGAGISTMNDSFEFTVNCSPYELFTGTEVINVNGGATSTVVDVPVRSTCTVTETNKPPVPQAAQDACAAQGLTAIWGKETYSSSNILTAEKLSIPGVTPSVEAWNYLQCTEPNWGDIKVMKHLEVPKDLAKTMPELEYTINIACNPGPANPTSVTFTLAGGSSPVENIRAPEGAVCTFTEELPSFPPELVEYCKNKRANRRGPAITNYFVPKWQKPSFVPSNVVTIGDSPRMVVKNRFFCGPRVIKKVIKKPVKIGMTTGGTGIDPIIKDPAIIGTAPDSMKNPQISSIDNSRLLRINAGKDKPGSVGIATSLNGSLSSDANEKSGFKFNWTQVSGPTVKLSDTESLTSSFVPEKAGVYIFELTVTNPQGHSKKDKVNIGVVDLKNIKKKKWKIFSRN